MNTEALYAQVAEKLAEPNMNMGALKLLAKELGRHQGLAEMLWQQAQLNHRLFAVLIFETKQLDEKTIQQLAEDLTSQPVDEQCRIADWLLANQLAKSARTKKYLEQWQHNPWAILRRLFWYQQARLRWTGQTPPPNSEALLADIE